MPVTSTMQPKRESVPDLTSSMGMASLSTTSFLFDDEEKSSGQKDTTSPDVKTYLQMNTTDDKFPILIRNNHHPGVVITSLTALDIQWLTGVVALGVFYSSGPCPAGISRV